MATPAALPPLPFNPSRVRSYLVRLPLFTRLVLLVILAFWLLEFQTIWSVVEWGSLTPDLINFGTMYRLNTFPFIHTGFFHAAVNALALTPLLERFEAEHGTLTSILLFVGRKSSSDTTSGIEHASLWIFPGIESTVWLTCFCTALSTFPAGLYLLFEKAILHRNTPVVGASVWVFLLLGSEAIRTYKSNPHFRYAQIQLLA
jgi:membrane associated rhomboid family serine protease